MEVKTRKTNAIDAITDVGLAVLEGNVNPLSAAVALREVKKAIEAVEKGIKSRVIEAAQLGTEGVDHGILKHEGYEITIQGGSGRYDFKDIKEVVDAEEQLKGLKEKHKQAYKMHLKGQLVVDEDTGEIVQPAGYKSNDPVEV